MVSAADERVARSMSFMRHQSSERKTRPPIEREQRHHVEQAQHEVENEQPLSDEPQVVRGVEPTEQPRQTSEEDRQHDAHSRAGDGHPELLVRFLRLTCQAGNATKSPELDLLDVPPVVLEDP